MTFPTSTWCAAALPLILGLPLLAQAPDPTGDGAFLPIPIHTAPDDPAGGPYGIWASGTHYKVSFHADPTFIPYLGRHYPRTQSLCFRTRDVRAGGKMLVAEDSEPQRFHTAWRYEYRFDELTEAYDVRPEGLEQTFVVHADPRAAGDLVVRGRFVTDLVAPETAAAHGAIAFADASGRELIRYGAATVVDAAGRRASIATSLSGGEVALTVPAAWLLHATYPVTIDPLLTPRTWSIDPRTADSIDVARDDASNTVLLGYTRNVSATDADAFGVRFGDGFTGGTVVFNDQTASWSTPTIACAVVGPEDRFVIAISREFTAPAGAAIRVWAQPTSIAGVDPTVVFGPFSAGTIDWRPSAGGIEPYDELGQPAAGSHALVAFQRDIAAPGTNTAESAVWGILVDCSTTPATLGTAFEVGSAAADLDAELPDVTKVSEGEQGTTPASWIVVYQEYSNAVAGDDWDIKGKRVDAAEAVSTSTYTTNDNSGEHRLAPKVAGQRGRYLLFYGREDEAGALTKIGGYEAQEVFSERFDWPAGGSSLRYPQQRVAGSVLSPRLYVVDDCAHDSDTDSFWLGAWRDAGAADELSFTRVGCSGQEVETATVASVGVIVAACDYDDDGNQFAVGYTTVPSPNSAVVGNVFAFPAEVAPAMTGTSCSAATLAWIATDQDGTRIAANDQQIGHQFTGVEVSGVPAGALMVMLISGASADLPVIDPAVAPGCSLLVSTLPPAYIGMTDFRFGPHQVWMLHLPEFLDPGTLYFQVWHIDPVTVLFNSTSRLEVPIVK